jgi:tRNA-binding protein
MGRVTLRKSRAGVKPSAFGREHGGPIKIRPLMATFDEFLNLDLRVGTVLSAVPLEGALKPAYRMEIDFGPELGTKHSSGQYTVNYRPEEMVGRQIIAVVNFPPRRVAGFKSEVLVLAAPDPAGAHVLLAVERPVPNGGRIS